MTDGRPPAVPDVHGEDARSEGSPSAPGQTADLGVVVVTYNSAEYIGACLESILRSGAGLDVQIVVVDNASSDNTRAIVDTVASPAVELVALDHNVGFGAACNIGVRHTASRVVVMANPDTVLEAGCLPALRAEVTAYPGAGLVGGRTLRPDGTTDPHSCWGQPSLWSSVCFATGLSTLFSGSSRFDPESLGSWARDTPREVGVVTGCLLAANRTTWDALGGFDEAYFMYSEDVDLSHRALRSGFRPRITPDAVAMHVVGASSASEVSRWILTLRGKVTFLRRCWPGSRARWGVALLVAGVGLRAALEVTRPGDTTYREVWAARAEWRRGWEAVDLPVAP